MIELYALGDLEQESAIIGFIIRGSDLFLCVMGYLAMITAHIHSGKLIFKLAWLIDINKIFSCTHYLCTHQCRLIIFSMSHSDIFESTYSSYTSRLVHNK